MTAIHAVSLPWPLGKDHTLLFQPCIRMARSPACLVESDLAFYPRFRAIAEARQDCVDTSQVWNEKIVRRTVDGPYADTFRSQLV